MVSIGRSYEISAGHHLPLHEGKCREPHGHNYVIEVTVQGELCTEGPSTGMVIDFADLDKAVKKHLDIIDHKDLNVVGTWKLVNPLPMPPTAENICSWLFKGLQDDFPIHSATIPNVVQLARVRVYETRNSFVEVTR